MGSPSRRRARPPSGCWRRSSPAERFVAIPCHFRRGTPQKGMIRSPLRKNANALVLDTTMLLLAAGATLFALVHMERLASRAVSAGNVAWHRHYQRLPRRANIVRNSFGKVGRTLLPSLTVRSPAPRRRSSSSLAPRWARGNPALLRWLEAEGFGEVDSPDSSSENESSKSSFPP